MSEHHDVIDLTVIDLTEVAQAPEIQSQEPSAIQSQEPPASQVEVLGPDAPDLGAPTLGAALEALLIVADEPVSLTELAATTGRPADEVAEVLLTLADEYTRAGRGFDLRESSGGWRFYTRGTCSEVVTRYVTEGQRSRLSQAALETLAVVAYRQPVARAHISAVRGVNVDGVVRTLLTRGLIEQVGNDPETGATLYGTSQYFLERLGLDHLDELPPLAPHVPVGEELDDLVGLVDQP